MGCYDYEDYYNEPSEFEVMIDELKQSLMNSVKQEHKDEIERLRKENKELQEIKKNFNNIKSDYELKVSELEFKESELERKVKRMRLDELFSEEFSVIMYTPESSVSVMKPKCDKCNSERKIEYKTPSGKTAKEDCICAKRYGKYMAKPYYLAEFRKSRSSDGLPLLMWYKKYRDYSSDYDGYTYDYSSLTKVIYDGTQSYEELDKVSPYDIKFRNEEDCQKYCDYLNKKNGITEDMVEVKRY